MLTDIVQFPLKAHSLSPWPESVRIISKFADALQKLGMGGVTRFQLAVYLWQKDISMAHGLFRYF